VAGCQNKLLQPGTWNLQPATCHLPPATCHTGIDFENFWFAVISDVHLQRKKIEGRERVTFPSVFTGNE
jgi:hypothetical protein